MSVSLETESIPSTPVDRWTRVLTEIRGDGLDCLQSTVAAMADQVYGPGTHLLLGTGVRFPVPDDDGVLGVQPDTAERLRQARDVLGFDVSQSVPAASANDLFDLAADGPVYVVAEAYDLRWLPYAKATVRYRKMPHSFLLEPADDPRHAIMVDAYFADTQWGRARPGTWVFSRDGFASAMRSSAEAYRIVPGGQPPEATPATVTRANAGPAEHAQAAITNYATTARRMLHEPEGIERLVLDIWHLTRERLLFDVWLSRHADDEQVHEAVREWQRLATQSYLASRRALRGSPPDPRLLDGVERRLHADRELVLALADRYAGSGDARAAQLLTAVVRRAVADCLGIDAEDVSADAVLRELPGFNSFRLIEIVDRVETESGTQLPESYDGSDLARVDGLVALFARGRAL